MNNMFKMFLDYRFYIVIYFLVGKSPLSRFGIPIEQPFSTMVLLFFIILILFLLSENQIIIPKTVSFIYINILYLIFIFSIINSQDVSFSFYNFFIPNITIYLTLIIIYLSINSIADVQILLKYFLYISLIILIIALFEVVRSGGNIDRLSILGGGPNTFYRFMIQTYILSLYFMFLSKSNNYFLAITAILSILLSLATGSKGALATFVIIWAIQFVISMNKFERNNTLKKIFISIIFVSPFIIFFNNIIEFIYKVFSRLDRTLSVFNYEELFYSTSSTARFNILRVAIDMFIEKPFLGWGPGGFNIVSNKFNYEHVYAHNTFFELLAEYGLFTLLVFLLLILTTIKNLVACNSGFKNIPFNNLKLLNSVFYLFLTYFIASMFSGNLIDSRLIFVFIILFDRVIYLSKVPHRNDSIYNNHKRRKKIDVFS